MSKYESHKTEFAAQGRFLGFASRDSYKLKYLRLSVNVGESGAGEYVIKIPKELRLALYRTLVPGDWVQVSGYQEFCSKQGTMKIKAYEVRPAAVVEPGSNTVPFVQKPVAAATSPQKANILVCQKSDCCKRGGRDLVKALQVELGDRGLADQVTIKPTGCMKQCKSGPNLVMPDKTRYSRIRANDIPDLLEKHFPAPAEPGVAYRR